MLLRALQERPSLLQPGSRLRCLAFGGEPCPLPQQLRPLWPAASTTRLFNIYGVTGTHAANTRLPARGLCWLSALFHPASSRRLLPITSPLSPSPLPPPTPHPECSCWSSIAEIDPHSTLPASLGEPMRDSGWRTRRSSTPGLYRLSLTGRRGRRCALSGELQALGRGLLSTPWRPPAARDTGDLVRMHDGQLFYVGREDNMVKRHGRRVHPGAMAADIQAVLQPHHPRAVQCVVVNVRPSNHQPHLVAFVSTAGEGGSSASAAALRRRWHPRLAQALAETPDDLLVLLGAWPLNANGKVDAAALAERYRRAQRTGAAPNAAASQDALALACRAQGVALPPDWPAMALAHVGGSSLTAVRIASHLGAALALSQAEEETLLLTLLSKPLNQALGLLQKHAAANNTRALGPETPAPRQQPALDYGRLRCPSPPPLRRRTRQNKTIRVQRAPHVDQTLHVAADAGICRLFDRLQPPAAHTRARHGARLRVLWRYNLGKCLDATPLLCSLADGRAVAFAGAHSHRFAAVCARSGSALWTTRLSDRIEAGGCLSRCAPWRTKCREYCLEGARLAFCASPLTPVSPPMCQLGQLHHRRRVRWRCTCPARR